MSAFTIGKIILTSLFKKASTIQYPISPKENDEMVRGHVGIDIENCIFCGICQKKCPTNCIEVIRNEKAWSIERFKCIQCNCCVESCPKKCLYMSNQLPSVSDKMIKDVVKDARIPTDTADHTDSGGKSQ